MPNFFPIIKASGSNYDIGYAIGKGTKKQIKRLIKILSKDYKKHTKKDFSNFIKSSQKFLKANKKQFPQYTEEIRGIADGAKISFEQAFALSCTDELAWDDPTHPLAEKCSTFISKFENKIFLCHNEDYTETFAGMLYIIKAKQKNKPSFVSLSYIGTLPGSSIGLNSSGIAASGNMLHAKDCRIGILKNFIYRALLDAKNTDDAMNAVVSLKRSTGGNYAIASREKCVNIETSAKDYAVTEIKEFPYFHTNHYLVEKMKKLQRHSSESSLKRYEHLQENGAKIKMFEDAKQLLLDHKAPICRHEEDKTGSITLGSAIADVLQKKLSISAGNPCKNKYKIFSL